MAQQQPNKADNLVKARAVAAANRAARKAAQQMSIDDGEGDEIEREVVTRAGVQPKGATKVSTRQIPKEPTREPARRHTERGGGVQVMGRNGEVLTRRRTVLGDVHDVPLNEIPAGWKYQWNVVTALNQEATKEQQVMYQNGWRPVPASRHAGRWHPVDYKGAIVVDGLRLEERPIELDNEARAEDLQKARALMRDQTDSLRLTEKLPKGMEASRKYRGTGADVRLSIDRALDIPAPQHQLDDGE